MKIKYMFHQRLIDVNGTDLLCCSSTLSMVECVVKEWNFRMVTFFVKTKFGWASFCRSRARLRNETWMATEFANVKVNIVMAAPQK
jgi:hypothetical protein